MFDKPHSAVLKVPVESLSPADSPRLEGLNHDHVQALAESGAELEPILVDRAAGRVVDGMHRLQATILRGDRDIALRYVEGPSADMFICAVKANISHGLPLTLRDRKAAVLRILNSHPHWSDRAIAAVTGVSPKTVGTLRGFSSEESPQSKQSVARVGMDGRARPVNMRERREKALALIAERPEAPLREVAERAGVSISTVHRLRRKVKSCPSTLKTAKQLAAPRASLMAAARPPGFPLASVPNPCPPAEAEHESAHSRMRAMEMLANDPSIRFTDSGRTLLRWLNGQARWLAASERLLPTVPPHCVRALSEVVSDYAKALEQLAGELQQTDQLDGSWRAVH
ncbi:helix-turn-helix domain-containing protein [Streptomyces sp. ACA25]|uniref:ParB/RepB/Spo0J family partition protein n=1 Tax=Streptomyces sp. ACA25 TaxID=3022596 RepID=UPI0023081072|nr:helix-turn-helix domain-containing protein [Streptomyces sp. ACA25]MDB1089740.1 helix-turn-helix domain-containing protein [Streptomyces sp. ACA25]